MCTGSPHVISMYSIAISIDIYPAVTFHPYTSEAHGARHCFFSFPALNILVWDWASYRCQIAVLVPNNMYMYMGSKDAQS